MQKKYSSDNTVHLTKKDLNTPDSMVEWLENNFSEIRAKDIEPNHLSSALDGILHDKNFISLSNEKKKEFMEIFNKLKNTLSNIKKLP